MEKQHSVDMPVWKVRQKTNYSLSQPKLFPGWWGIWCTIQVNDSQLGITQKEQKNSTFHLWGTPRARTRSSMGRHHWVHTFLQSVWGTRQSLDPSLQNEPNHSTAKKAEARPVHQLSLHTALCSVLPWEATAKLHQRHKTFMNEAPERQSGLNTSC